MGSTPDAEGDAPDFPVLPGTSVRSNRRSRGIAKMSEVSCTSGSRDWRVGAIRRDAIVPQKFAEHKSGLHMAVAPSLCA